MIDPLHQFAIKTIFPISVGGIDFSFTNSSLSILIVVLLMYGLFTAGVRNKKLVPNKVQAVVEMFYKLIAELICDNVGKGGQKYFPFVFSIFIFIFLGNILGMIPYMFTFTSHIIVTFTLAMLVFLFVTVLGICLHGWEFLHLFAPRGLPKYLLIVIVPIELISYLSRPISLSVRLFANMMAGHTMMKVFAAFVTLLLASSAEAAKCVSILPIIINTLLTAFEIVIAVLQAYVFTILTCVYLNDAVNLH